MDKDTLKIVPGGAGPEAALALINLGQVLKAAGSSIENVVKTTVFLNDMNDFGIVNEEYKKGQFIFITTTISIDRLTIYLNFSLHP